MWERFDAGEIRADFAHIAALGLDTVRFFLRWDLFAPQPDAVDTLMLERLETVVNAAGDCGLQAMPVLLGGYLGGPARVPAWARDASDPQGVGNIYTGVPLEAQEYFARAAAQRLRGHPALGAWDIGHRLSSMRRPSSVKVSAGEHSSAPADEAVVAAWSRRLTAALQTFDATPVTLGTHSDDLTADRNIRLGSLCAPLSFASMQATSVEVAFARGRLDPEMLPFLALLTAAFSYKPVLITGFGNPTCPPGTFSAFERFALANEPPTITIAPDDPVFAPYPCLTEDENAFVCTNMLERLHADGRLGALWWSWSDAAPDGDAAVSPEREHQRSFGIVRSDGSERPVAAALAAFAARRSEVVAPHDMPLIASAYYYRTLPTSTSTLYEAYLRFIAARRESS
jgi:hypothetical protein